MQYRFSHVGVPTDCVREKEIFEEELKVWRCDAADSPQHIEYLRFPTDSALPAEIMQNPHVGYFVEDIRAALSEMDQTVFGPWNNGREWIAFARKAGFLFELIQEAQ